MSYTLARRGLWQRDGGFDLPGACKLARELGIDAIDMVSTYDRPPAEIRRILDDHGIRAACFTRAAPALCSESASERAAGVDSVKEMLDIAGDIGSDKIMVIPHCDNTLPRDIARRRYIRGFCETAGLARAAGITVTIENFPSGGFVTSSDVLEAIREVPGLKLTFDNGNVLLGGEDSAVSFERSAEHVVFAHFKDWVRTAPGEGRQGLDGRWYQPALIGEGIVDHQGCLAAMRRQGYPGYINVEYEGADYPPDEATRRAVAYLRGILDALANDAATTPQT